MSVLFEEIKRLKYKLAELEQEQERQDKELHETIRDFEEISRLEAELLGIDYEVLKEKVLNNIAFIRDTEQETQKLESDLSEADKIRLQRSTDNVPAVHDDEETQRLERELAELDGVKTQQLKHYFTICLISSDGNHNEWTKEAGGGWRGKGLGHQYANRDEALKNCEQLKKRFPNYQIQLVEKSN